MKIADGVDAKNENKINPLQLFIVQSKTNDEYPCLKKEEFEQWKVSEDMQRYKTFLAEQTQQLKDLANKQINN